MAATRKPAILSWLFFVCYYGDTIVGYGMRVKELFPLSLSLLVAQCTDLLIISLLSVVERAECELITT